MLVVEAGKCYLIDVTPERFGDATSDIGEFLAQLEKHRDGEWLSAFHPAFLDEYVAHIGAAVVPRILVYQALALVRLATKYALEEPDAKHFSVSAMIERADELMQQAKAEMAERDAG